MKHNAKVYQRGRCLLRAHRASCREPWTVIEPDGSMTTVQKHVSGPGVLELLCNRAVVEFGGFDDVELFSETADGVVHENKKAEAV